MTTEHPLDRPIWAMLTGRRQSGLAVVEGGARRLDAAYGIFAAADGSQLALADLGRLVRALGDVALAEPEAPPPVPGARVASQAALWQMIAEGPAVATDTAAFPIAPLDDNDAPEMLALATLTQPGPFFARTHQLGDFVGVKVDGRLAAMAGERMKPDGFTEVSGVCTHPDFRGRGYAAGLMTDVMGRIRARGETPFLHVYASNEAGIALHRSLGFVLRRELVMTGLTAG